jgi:hypothetical protein
VRTPRTTCFEAVHLVVDPDAQNLVRLGDDRQEADVGNPEITVFACCVGFHFRQCAVFNHGLQCRIAMPEYLGYINDALTVDDAIRNLLFALKACELHNILS